MSSTCPCCGQPLKPLPLQWSAETRTVMRDGMAVRLGAQKARIFDVLFRSYPETISRDALVERAWAHDPNGGPERANVASVHLHRMRPLLAPLRVRVAGSYGSVGIRVDE